MCQFLYCKRKLKHVAHPRAEAASGAGRPRALRSVLLASSLQQVLSRVCSQKASYLGDGKVTRTWGSSPARLGTHCAIRGKASSALVPQFADGQMELADLSPWKRGKAHETACNQVPSDKAWISHPVTNFRSLFFLKLPLGSSCFLLISNQWTALLG